MNNVQSKQLKPFSSICIMLKPCEQGSLKICIFSEKNNGIFVFVFFPSLGNVKPPPPPKNKYRKQIVRIVQKVWGNFSKASKSLGSLSVNVISLKARFKLVLRQPSMT